jgi:prepilin-type N-terminal cleavage/methylation domain-containing protein
MSVTRDRLAAEDGFTLVELLASMLVGAVVIFAVFGLLDAAVRLQAKSVDGVDATSRGRLAIDQVSQSLGSRICLGAQSSLVDARDASVEFYASLAPESSAVRLIVQRRRLTVAGTTLREEIWTSSPPVAPPNLPPASTTAPSRTRELLSAMAPTGSTPVFRYYAYQGTPSRPTQLLSTPLSAIDLARVAVIDVGFTARGKRPGVGTAFSTQIFNRSTTCVT